MTVKLERVAPKDRLVEVPFLPEPPHAFFIFCPNCRSMKLKQAPEGKLSCEYCKKVYTPCLNDASESSEAKESQPVAPKLFSLVFCIIKPKAKENWLAADGKGLREIRSFFETDLDVWSAIVPAHIEPQTPLKSLKDDAGDCVAFCIRGVDSKYRSIWESDGFSRFALNRFLDEAAEAGKVVSSIVPIAHTFIRESGLQFKTP